MDVYSFMRRFLLHVVPYRFVRIRYYGILSHRNKRKTIATCREFYNVATLPEQISPDWRDIFLKKTGRGPPQCPVCKKGRLVVMEILVPARYRSPPALVPIDGPFMAVR